MQPDVTALPSGAAAETTRGADTWTSKPHPTDGRPFYSLTFRLTKFTHYKPAGRKQMGGAKGRWQERGEYGGWDNCAAPTGPWIFAGRTVPDALHLALAAPELFAALRSVLDAFAATALDTLTFAQAEALSAARAAVAAAKDGGRDG